MHETMKNDSNQNMGRIDSQTVGDILFNLSDVTLVDFSTLPTLKLIFDEYYKDPESNETARCTFTVTIDPEISPFFTQVLRNATITGRNVAKSNIKYTELLDLKYSSVTCIHDYPSSETNNRDLYTISIVIPGLYQLYQKSIHTEVLGNES